MKLKGIFMIWGIFLSKDIKDDSYVLFKFFLRTGLFSPVEEQ